MSTKFKIIIYAVIIASIVILGFLFVAPKKITNHEQSVNQTPLTIPADKNIQLTFDFGNEQKLAYAQDNWPEPQTVYDLLTRVTAEQKIIFKTKQYDFGVLVDAIGDKTNGEDNRYWLYYVNGEMPMVAIDKYELKAGDKVDLKFEASAFN